MRNISIREDIEVVILQLVLAIPDVFLNYDVNSIELVESSEAEGRKKLVGSWDIVFVESDDYEVIIGEALLGSDLFVEIDIFKDEDELELTFDDII